MGHQAAASGYEDCNQDDCPADIGQQLPHEQGDVMAAKMKVNAHNVAVSVALRSTRDLRCQSLTPAPQ